MSDGSEAELRRPIARDSVARIAALGGVNETEMLGIPFEELDSIRELVHETADEFGVDVETEDRIGEQGLVHLAIWRAGAERSGALGDLEPPRSQSSGGDVG
jgi:hypothetical protein